MKTRITLDPCELDANGQVAEVLVSVERDGGDRDLRDQSLILSAEELQFLYHRMRAYYEQGTWTTGTVDW